MLAPYRNMAHAVREIAREEGFRGFYRGLAPSLLLVSPDAPTTAVGSNRPNTDQTVELVTSCNAARI